MVSKVRSTTLPPQRRSDLESPSLAWQLGPFFSLQPRTKVDKSLWPFRLLSCCFWIQWIFTECIEYARYSRLKGEVGWVLRVSALASRLLSNLEGTPVVCVLDPHCCSTEYKKLAESSNRLLTVISGFTYLVSSLIIFQKLLVWRHRLPKVRCAA